MAGQLSPVVTLGVLVASGCSHAPTAATPGWHQMAHSIEALGPTASVSTIDRTAARNTLMLTRRKGKSGANLARRNGSKSPRFLKQSIAQLTVQRNFADAVPKIPQFNLAETQTLRLALIVLLAPVLLKV